MNLTGDTGVTSTDSARASQLIEEATGSAPAGEEFVLVEAGAGAFDETLFTSVVGDISADMRAIPIVIEVTSYQDGAYAFLTPDGRKALIQVITSLDQDDNMEEMDAILDLVEARWSRRRSPKVN
jgi:hypothetical protein